MNIEFIVNGGVSMLISPETPMEEEMLKQMLKQSNDITEIRSAVQVLNKSFKYGILIGKNSNRPDENQKETV